MKANPTGAVRASTSRVECRRAGSVGPGTPSSGSIGEIAGAALDVFETEPLPAEHPLWGLENVLLTPHIAAASPRIAERHLETLLENVRCYAAGEDLVTVAEKSRWF